MDCWFGVLVCGRDLLACILEVVVIALGAGFVVYGLLDFG